MMSDYGWIDDFITAKKPFAVCALPDSNEVKVFTHFDNDTLRNDAGDVFNIEPESGGDFSSPQNTTTEQAHSIMVEHAVDAIKLGVVQKVIISTLKHAERNGQLMSSVFERLLTSYPTAFRYVCFHPAYGLWAGASPELLLKKEGNNYYTTALAGTIKSEANQPQEWNDKLIHEQALVTNGITSHLKTIGIYDLNISEPKPHKAGPVTHLKTDIDFVTEASLGHVLEALHPTAAVCGFPREEAKALYRSLEEHERRLYTGYLGVKQADGDLRYFVNLRCMQIFDDHFELHVGGGITSGSIAKDEWEETENKAKVLRQVIQ